MVPNGSQNFGAERKRNKQVWEKVMALCRPFSEKYFASLTFGNIDKK